MGCWEGTARPGEDEIVLGGGGKVGIAFRKVMRNVGDGRIRRESEG